MNWLNLHVGFLTESAFVGATPVQRATWLCLVSHCVRQENGGLIAGCADWGSRRWMQTCGVTKDEVAEPCDLWTTEAGGVRVWGYPAEREREVKAMREGGRAGGRRSGETRRKTFRNEALPEASNEGGLQGGLERKGKEGEGKDKGRTAVGGGTGGGDNDPPAGIEELKAVSVRIGMPDFDGWLAYWRSMNWIVAYNGTEHRMLPREIQRSMTNWKMKAKEIEHANDRRSSPGAGDAKRPAGYLKSPTGKYTPENCGF